MQPHAVTRNALDHLVDGRYAPLHRFNEAGVIEVAVHHDAIHGEIGGVDLQQEARFVNRLAFVLHLAR